MHEKQRVLAVGAVLEAHAVEQGDQGVAALEAAPVENRPHQCVFLAGVFCDLIYQLEELLAEQREQQFEVLGVLLEAGLRAPQENVLAGDLAVGAADLLAQVAAQEFGQVVFALLLQGAHKRAQELEVPQEDYYVVVLELLLGGEDVAEVLAAVVGAHIAQDLLGEWGLVALEARKQDLVEQKVRELVAPLLGRETLFEEVLLQEALEQLLGVPVLVLAHKEVGQQPEHNPLGHNAADGLRQHPLVREQHLQSLLQELEKQVAEVAGLLLLEGV